METLFFLASNTLGMIARVETWALILMAPDLPLVDGIIVPGGAGQTVAYRSWGGPQLNEAGERLTQGAMPALRGIWRLDRNLLGVNLALKEYLGTFAYRDFDK